MYTVQTFWMPSEFNCWQKMVHGEIYSCLSTDLMSVWLYETNCNIHCIFWMTILSTKYTNNVIPFYRQIYPLSALSEIQKLKVSFVWINVLQEIKPHVAIGFYMRILRKFTVNVFWEVIMYFTLSGNAVNLQP